MPLLIDLFAGEGGAAEGYVQAGWDVIGIDIRKQPKFPYAFIQGDSLKVDARLMRLADAFHASPPCQFGSEVTPHVQRRRQRNLIPAVRKILQATGKPYVIENVRGVRAHLENPVSLFGTMFGNHCVDSQGRRFVLSRERLFETNWPLEAPPNPGTRGVPIANVFGGHFRVRGKGFRTGKGTDRTVDLPGEDRQALARQLMGMPWATMRGMSEAVPPAYCRFVGRKLLVAMARGDA